MVVIEAPRFDLRLRMSCAASSGNRQETDSCPRETRRISVAYAGAPVQIYRMLDAFIVSNRDAIINRTKARVAARTGPKSTGQELPDGIPAFLDHLIAALRLADRTDAIDHAQIKDSARQHGEDLLGKGFTIEQVVHDYGDVCQVVTGLAIEQNARIPTEEFQVLNLCLDDAIAAAITAYSARILAVKAGSSPAA